LFAIRPFYLTVKSFRKAVNDVILSRRAINAMNNLFPLATAQDLAESKLQNFYLIKTLLNI